MLFTDQLSDYQLWAEAEGVVFKLMRNVARVSEGMKHFCHLAKRVSVQDSVRY
jgi:hypothetical protein